MGSGGGGGPSSQTTTSISKPPEYVEEPAKRFLSRAEDLSQTPYSTYQGQRISPLNAAHQQGLQSALYTPEVNQARNLNAYTLGGGFLNSNPYLDQTFNRAADQVQSRMSNAVAGNNLTNTGVQEVYNRGLNDLATNIYGGNYSRERQLQQQAIPGSVAIPQAQSQLQLGAGDIMRDLSQANINEAIRKFEEQRQSPYANLDVLGRAIGASMGSGGSTATTSPGYYQPSSTAGMLGGGLLGYGLGQGFNNQYGGPIGAGLGALAGGFSR